MADFILLIPILLLSLSIHEYSHAKAADYLGDPTARMLGRLTINPINHLDPIGALVLLLTRRFGWAKPVHVNPVNFDNPKRDMMIVSFAGPFSNLVLAFIFSLLFRLASFLINMRILPYAIGNPVFYLVQMIYVGIYLNVGLAVFNLLPIPPLDGSKILRGLAPVGWYKYFQVFEGPYGMLILILLVSFGILGRIASPIINFIANLLLIGV